MPGIDRRKFLALAAAGAAVAARSGAPPAEEPSDPSDRSGPWLQINLDAVAWNLARIRKLVGGRPVMGVIKCNAYGHGLVGLGRFLEAQGIAALAVVSVAEALALRHAGVRCPILNLGPFSAAEAVELVRAGVSQSVYTEQFSDLAASARKLGLKAKVQVKIDTGLGRVGVPHYRALPLIRDIASDDAIAIEGVFTSLTEDEDFDREQLRLFLEICETARAEGIDLGLRHAASSAGILSFPAAHLDMVRPGITLYGHYPSEKARLERKVELRPAMQLKAPVLYVKRLRPGDGVSYHKAFVAQRETNVATLGIGYSDGCPQQLAGSGYTLIGGRRRPMIAAVTSNHASANLEDAQDVQVGDEAVIFGSQGGEEISAEEVAAIAGVSIYKLLIQMNPLLPRRVLHGSP